MNDGITWQPSPAASAYLDELLNCFVLANPLAAAMQARLLHGAGVAMIHLIDHWVLPEDAGTAHMLRDAGFEPDSAVDGRPWHCPGARLPRVRFEEGLEHPRMALGVDSIDAFEAAWDLPHPGRRGDTESGYEETRYRLADGEIAAIVRLGYRGFQPGELSASELRNVLAVRNRLYERSRHGSLHTVLETACEVLKFCVEMVGTARTVDELFAAEREYYMTRNVAARYQFHQQESLGIGWANQDHHTYRCSREGFGPLLALWKDLGFKFRERYYAGDEAGWGAQILEHEESRVVLFCDVDMAPEELEVDFTAAELSPLNRLGTIGLWCALHGDSICAAGLHHLECEFDFERARDCLEVAGHQVMPPFTDLPLLKQAFTVGEIWPVTGERIDALVADGMITNQQAATFAERGATGSHLELLQRWQGFKGFNKTGVSAIIRATDARGEQGVEGRR